MDFKAKLQEIEKTFAAKQQIVKDLQQKLQQAIDEVVEVRGAYKYIETLQKEVEAQDKEDKKAE
jgi:hypothetical protein